MRAPRPGEAHLYLVQVPTGAQPLEPLLARLSPGERERAAAKRVAAKRREYVTGQAALRTLLGRMLGRDPLAVSYRRGVKGKPYLATGSPAAAPLQFNITHSGSLVVVAVACGVELGIDVEWHNLRTDPERVARRAFTADERAALAREPESRRRSLFFQLWTCKEALVKCTGLGIHSGMHHYQVALTADRGGARVAAAWGKQTGVERLHVVPLPLGGDHSGALVHEPPALALRRWQLADTPDPLAAI